MLVACAIIVRWFTISPPHMNVPHRRFGSIPIFISQYYANWLQCKQIGRVNSKHGLVVDLGYAIGIALLFVDQYIMRTYRGNLRAKWRILTRLEGRYKRE